MTAPTLTDAECDALILDAIGQPADRIIRDELLPLRVVVRHCYAAGLAAAPRAGEPVAWYAPLIGNYAHVVCVWGKRPDTPMEWAPLYAAPAVAQDKEKP